MIDPGEFRNGAGRPVVALDLDGTLGNYHSHFLWFAEQWLGKRMPHADTINSGMRLSEFMGINHDVYRRVKLAYRQGGLKRWMPAYPGAKDLTHAIRNAGAELWICTTRPYFKLDNIDPDTREWLQRNDIAYDYILFDDALTGTSKYEELIRQVPRERIAADADDLPEQVDLAIMCGIRNVYIRDQPYNRHYNDPNVIRVKDLFELRTNIVEDITRWHRVNSPGGG